MAPRQQGSSSRGKRGSKKYGRNRKKCERYRAMGRREKNKARRMAKREKKYARNRTRRMNDGKKE